MKLGVAAGADGMPAAGVAFLQPDMDDPDKRDAVLFQEIVGRSQGLRVALTQVATVAKTESTVLIQGETGTGKELIARAVHRASPRCGGPFVTVNCAAIPSSLLESELFGHERGAFTGAVARRVGRFELAQHGTVFLDEIGELPLDLQPKLLRLLQEREFERLGSSRTLRSNVRLIAATHRDLAAMASAQAFRQDLYYRLNVFPIYVPPLRERTEDIALLAQRFVQQICARIRKPLSGIAPAVLAQLEQYDWPGNVRELQNVLEHAAILATGPELTSLGQALERRASAPPLSSPEALSARALRDVERAHILAVLERTNWIVAGPRGAAAILGLKRSTLNFRMGKLGIVRATRAAPRGEREEPL